jgi:hypothetical protein
MPRRPDSGRIDLPEIFHRVQSEMLAQLKVGGLFEHASTMGAATEKEWLNLFHRYLPQRYRATPAFVIDSAGNRSRQIDIAIYDNLYSPMLFPHDAGQHIPAESIYAVFEVKPTISKQWVRDAAEKAASVRQLRRTTVPVIAGGKSRQAIPLQPILAGLLATSSVWTESTFPENVREAVLSIDPAARLDLGCSLEHGSFEYVRSSRPLHAAQSTNHLTTLNNSANPDLSRDRRERSSARVSTTRKTSRARQGGGRSREATVHVSRPDESLIFFILRLLDRLREMGTAPAADLMQYARTLRSLH